ncbi:MAG: hypothetical protein KDH97_03150 [Calditrichaeota bacterium]|nr:hypothetical protein [Calditrichota bacterium]MCB0289234.1 hypothetical protein [Calditrichota bacterium]MCB0294616.1 hypothetical protein [Calditrichota bacterium]MCB0302175.1 hypothetical protein [Calditrichota bacterium]
MKQLIEYLEVWLEKENQRSRRQSVSAQQLAEMITDPGFHGASALLNVRSLSGVRAYLLLSKGDIGSLIQPGGNAAPHLPDLAQLLIYPLNLNGQPAGGNKPAAFGKTDRFSPAKQNASPEAESSPSTNGETMTTPQRRYLFRLLAEKKQLKGKQAEDYLKETLEVTSIQEIDKVSASQLIDHLLNGGN